MNKTLNHIHTSDSTISHLKTKHKSLGVLHESCKSKNMWRKLYEEMVVFNLQVCHDNLPLSCYLEPLELLLLLEQSPAQNWVICFPQLDNTPHSRYVCNHSTSSSEAVNMANFPLWETCPCNSSKETRNPEGRRKKNVKIKSGDWTQTGGTKRAKKNLWKFRLSSNWWCTPSHHICSQSIKVLAPSKAQ